MQRSQCHFQVPWKYKLSTIGRSCLRHATRVVLLTRLYIVYRIKVASKPASNGERGGGQGSLWAFYSVPLSSYRQRAGKTSRQKKLKKACLNRSAEKLRERSGSPSGAMGLLAHCIADSSFSSISVGLFVNGKCPTGTKWLECEDEAVYAFNESFVKATYCYKLNERNTKKTTERDINVVKHYERNMRSFFQAILQRWQRDDPAIVPVLYHQGTCPSVLFHRASTFVNNS